MAELAMFITVRTQPGQRDALRALWEAHLKPRAADNPAQSRYVYAYDDADADVIHIAEVYETRAAMAQNGSAEWFADYMEAAMPLLDGPPDVRMGTPVWVK